MGSRYISYHLVELRVLVVLTAVFEAALEIYRGLCLSKPKEAYQNSSPQMTWALSIRNRDKAGGVEQGDRIQVLRLLQDQRGIITKFDLDLSSFPYFQDTGWGFH